MAELVMERGSTANKLRREPEVLMKRIATERAFDDACSGWQPFPNNELPEPLRSFVRATSAAIRITRWFAHEALRVNAMLIESPPENPNRQLVDFIVQRVAR